MSADHNAVDSTLGYNYQTLHALIVLLRANDDESVTLELTDDVTLHHKPVTSSEPDDSRFQVSHSIKEQLPEITASSTKLWKTLRIWASEYDQKERYFLLTCAPVSPDLTSLTAAGGDRAAVQQLLETEAQRVVSEAQRKVHEHKDRSRCARCKPAHSPGDLSDKPCNRSRCCPRSPDLYRSPAATSWQAVPGNGKTTLLTAKLGLLSRTWRRVARALESSMSKVRNRHHCNLSDSLGLCERLDAG
jgi:hypothetical protein